MRRRISSVFVLLILLTASSFGQMKLPENFDAFVDSVMKTFEVPGIALAIVKDGQVVIAKGYGVKTLGTSDKVDSRTNFGIASNTKAFTATALGILVEEKKIRWDDRVIDYLPWFRLSDPYVTREMTIRDLLVHRSGLGLGAGDLLWWPATTYDRKEIARRLRNIPLSASFRTAYAYDNVLYLIAGEVIEAVSGMSWEEFVQTRILDEVGMTRSNVRHSDASRKGNVATPHAAINGTVRPITAFDSDNTNPAGGINSNAEDMAKWLICQLDSGRAEGGKKVFSPATSRQLWNIVTPRMPGPPNPKFPPLKANFLGYALGFEVRDYRGEKLVTHTGGLPGYVSRVAMLPDLRAGVAVLTNQESGEAFNTVAYSVLDLFLGAHFDYLGAFKWLKAAGDSAIAAAEGETFGSRDTLSKPSLALTSYAGVYTDAWYGDLRIERADNGLRIRMVPTPSLVGKLEHYQYDTFIARWSDPEMRADAFVTFCLNPDGSVADVKMKPVSPATDFSFDFQDLLFKPAR